MSFKETGGRLSISLLLGMLLIPTAAVVAVTIVTPEAQADGLPPEMTIPSVPGKSAATQKVIVEPVAASAEDLEAACGDDGYSLVSAESEGTITEVQQAGLDALRQLCAEVRMPLPDPPAPPPIVRTEVREVPDDHEETDSDDEYEETDSDDEYEDHEDDDDATEADYVSAHASAVKVIDDAIAQGGDGEKIDEALKKLAEAERKAARLDWGEAIEKTEEARRKAAKATGGDS